MHCFRRLALTLPRNGDLNILGDFVAFASPMDPLWMQRTTAVGQKVPQFSLHQVRMLNGAFEKVRDKFSTENVGLVVRLNDELYDRTNFIENGIEHGRYCLPFRR